MNRRVSARILCGSLAFCLVFCSGCGVPLIVKDTDLKGEGLNGIAVDSVYEGTKAEQAFGKLFREDSISRVDKYYNYFSEESYTIVNVRNQKVTKLYSQWLPGLRGETVTKREISNTSSLDDVTRAYGENYIRMDYNNEMGEKDHYVIRYRDRKDRICLTFQFLEGETSNADITVEKY